MTTSTAERFSHNQREYIRDPYPFYATMRAEQPAFYSQTIFGGTWLFFGYEDCVRLMKDERLSNARAAVPLWFLPDDQKSEFADMIGIYERWLAFHDGGEHTVNRRQANRSYRPFTDERLEGSIQSIVDGLLDAVGDEFDLMRDFAFPLPSMVIASVLGVPIDAHADLTRWTDDIAHLFGSTHVTVEHIRKTRQSTLELAAFLDSPACRQHAEHEQGLLHTLRTTEVHGHRFSDEDVTAQAALLLFAGVASIRYLIGNAVVTLQSLPAESRLSFGNPVTSESAVEEILRFCTPVQFVGRVAREDFSFTAVSGKEVVVKAGRPMILYVASANRDDAKFERAGEVDLARPNNDHLTFGAGRHLCFGDPLVRQTMRIALATLYRRFPSLRIRDDEPDWNNNLGFHGVTSLPVSAR